MRKAVSLPTRSSMSLLLAASAQQATGSFVGSWFRPSLSPCRAAGRAVRCAATLPRDQQLDAIVNRVKNQEASVIDGWLLSSNALLDGLEKAQGDKPATKAAAPPPTPTAPAAPPPPPAPVPVSADGSTLNVFDWLQAQVRAALVDAFGPEYADTPPLLAQATRPEFGDYQCNVAMGLAKKLKSKPRDVAEQIVAKLAIGAVCEEVEIAGPGFLNLRLKKSFIQEQLRLMLDSSERCGVPSATPSQRVVVDCACALGRTARARQTRRMLAAHAHTPTC